MLASAPLLLLSLSAWFYTTEERKGNPSFIFKGMIGSFPAILLWLAITWLLKPVWGSASLVFYYWFKYFLLPVFLAAPVWGLANHWVSFRNFRSREILAFMLPYATAFLAVWMAQSWGTPFAAASLALPLLTLGAILALAGSLELCSWYGFPAGLSWLLVWVASGLLSAVAYSLFFLRYELAGLLLTLAVTAGGSVFGIIVLKRRFNSL